MGDQVGLRGATGLRYFVGLHVGRIGNAVIGILSIHGSATIPAATKMSRIFFMTGVADPNAVLGRPQTFNNAFRFSE